MSIDFFLGNEGRSTQEAVTGNNADKGKVGDNLQTVVQPAIYERTWKGIQDIAYKNYQSKKVDFYGFCLGGTSRFSGWLFLSSLSSIHVLPSHYLHNIEAQQEGSEETQDLPSPSNTNGTSISSCSVDLDDFYVQL